MQMCSCPVSVYSFLTIYCWLVKIDISAKMGNDIVTDLPGDYLNGEDYFPVGCFSRECCLGEEGSTCSN